MAKASTISVENNLSSPSLSFSTAACHWRHINLWLVSDCRLPAASHKLQACIKIPDASQAIEGHPLYWENGDGSFAPYIEWPVQRLRCVF